MAKTRNSELRSSQPMEGLSNTAAIQGSRICDESEDLKAIGQRIDCPPSYHY